MTVRRFKVGDRVQVIGPHGAYVGVCLGMEGTVVSLSSMESVELAVPRRVGGRTNGGYFVGERYLELVSPINPWVENL